MALIDEDKNYIIHWYDNIHGNPKEYIEAFTDALKYYNIEFEIRDIVMLDKDLYTTKYSGKRY